MKIPFILNKKRVVAEAEPGTRLIQVLRDSFKLTGAKKGCNSGRCGSCMVLLDRKPVSACIIPIAIIKDSDVVTIEYFSATPDYTDIINGFSQAGINLCGFCNAGKILTAHSILEQDMRPSKEKIREILVGNMCPCTSIEMLITGIRIAGVIKRKRLDERQ